MSDLMFNETPVIGDKYVFEDWKKYAIHSEKVIAGFFGDYRWLSNFYKTDVYFEGLAYPNSECAFQAAKVLPINRFNFINISAADSKKEWKKYPLLDESAVAWNFRKYDVMSVILFEKFYRNIELRKKLIETKDRYLEETNHWKDTDWGVDIKLGGKNNLGIILMKIRNFWTK